MYKYDPKKVPWLRVGPGGQVGEKAIFLPKKMHFWAENDIFFKFILFLLDVTQWLKTTGVVHQGGDSTKWQAWSYEGHLMHGGRNVRLNGTRYFF